MAGAGQGRKFGRRALYAATLIAMVGATAGFVLAGVLAPATPVSQTSSSYTVNTGAGGGFPNAPTVGAGALPGSASPCASSATLASGGSVVLTLPASAGIAACNPGDYVEVFTLTTSASAPVGVYNVTVFDNYVTTGPGGIAGTATGQITITGSALTSAGTVTLYVDFGPTPPQGGIGTLDLIVSQGVA
jgi:hypothetical protein